MEFGNYKYPVFQVPENRNLNEILVDESKTGLGNRLSGDGGISGTISEESKREYQERLDYELGIIQDMGFAGYFLIVADFIDYARRCDIQLAPAVARQLDLWLPIV